MDVCYNVQAAVDAKNKLIIDFEVTNSTSDINQLAPMGSKVKEILEVDEIAMTADCGYNSATDIANAVQIGIVPHVAETDFDICVPVKEGEAEEITSQNNGRCIYVAERNIGICPMGNILYPGTYTEKTGKASFYNSEACKACNCRCIKSASGKKFQIVMAKSDFKKEYDDKGLVVKQVHIKPDEEIYKQRKSLSEHPFGTIKSSMDGRNCLTKGIEKVTGEFSLIFLAYNLKRVINILEIKKLIERMGGKAC